MLYSPKEGLSVECRCPLQKSWKDPCPSPDLSEGKNLPHYILKRKYAVQSVDLHKGPGMDPASSSFPRGQNLALMLPKELTQCRVQALPRNLMKVPFPSPRLLLRTDTGLKHLQRAGTFPEGIGRGGNGSGSSTRDGKVNWFIG